VAGGGSGEGGEPEPPAGSPVSHNLARRANDLQFICPNSKVRILGAKKIFHANLTNI
jgi:hypothetical protein